jgi:hypothetical protein
MKALVIHTAWEAGPDPGPDYMYGWGLMNTLLSAEYIDADALGLFRYIHELTLEQGEADTLRFYYSSQSPLKVTMAWTDPPGTPPAASLDPTNPMLVNDLDVRIYDGDGNTLPPSRSRPWILDPANPSDRAIHGDNDVDNVEQIYVDDGLASGNYMAVITHEGPLLNGHQDYSIILSSPNVWLSQCELDPCFHEITPPGLRDEEEESRSCSWVDYDGDGRQDIFVTNRFGANRLIRNLGGGIFESQEIGPLGAEDLPTSQAVWGDFDGDGDLDVYLVHDGAPNQLFRNDGDFGFLDVDPAELADPGPGVAAAWIDYDLDGKLDLYLSIAGADNRLFRNDGELGFTDVTPVELRGLGPSRGIAWGDYDNDRDPDLYLVHDGAPNQLFRNDGDLGFTDVTSGSLGDPGQSHGAVWADYDNDTNLDLYVANDGPNRLFKNLGNGDFAEVVNTAIAHPGRGRGATWGDVDNDGDLDLYLVNASQPNVLYLNEGNGTFDEGDTTVANALSGVGAGMADYDFDGDLDILQTNGSVEEANALYANFLDSPASWLHVDLLGRRSNRLGIGARIEAVTSTGTQIREVGTGCGFMGQNSLTAEFGLASSDHVELLRILWPSGEVQELLDVEANQGIQVEEPLAPADADGPNAGTLPVMTRLLSTDPNPFNPVAQVRFQLANEQTISLRIYAPSGRLVRVLSEGPRPAGTHSVIWDGRDEQGHQVESGLYFVRLIAGGKTDQGKAILLK